jgi:hypothetical protein
LRKKRSDTAEAAPLEKSLPEREDEGDRKEISQKQL